MHVLYVAGNFVFFLDKSGGLLLLKEKVQNVANKLSYDGSNLSVFK